MRAGDPGVRHLLLLSPVPAAEEVRQRQCLLRPDPPGEAAEGQAADAERIRKMEAAGNVPGGIRGYGLLTKNHS